MSATVQTVTGPVESSELLVIQSRGVARRFVVATWGLARPVGHVGAGLA
jgi:hypothetical protein